MTPSRFQQRIQGQSSIAKKVFQFVPIKEAWDITQIISEMRRATRTNPDPHIVRGCINTLKESGLIDEISKNQFIRIEVKERIEVPPIKEIEIPAQQPKEVMTKPQAEPTKKSPIELLSGLSTRLSAISQSIKSIADDIDAAAVEIEDGIAANEANVAKLRQLQVLLKGLM